MTVIVDYDAGNLRSVEKAVEYLGYPCKVTRERDEILSSDHIILPGVGAFGDAMEKLRRFGLDSTLADAADAGNKILGICLGLQLFFASSQESPGETGLDLLPGRIVRIPSAEGLKIPHIGWNTLDDCKESRLLHGIEEGTCVYFVHSYYLQAEDPGFVIAHTHYGVSMDICVEKENLFACQFHPEKSGKDGLTILKNFLEV